MPARTKHQDASEARKMSIKPIYSSKTVAENGKDKKVRNLDTMLAQLCILDNTLEKKKTTSKREKKQRRAKAETIHGNADDVKIQDRSDERTEKPNVENNSHNHTAVLHRQPKTKNKKSECHETVATLKNQIQSVAPGFVHKAVTKERTNKDSYLDPTTSNGYERRDMKKSEHVSLVSGEACKLSNQSSLTTSANDRVTNKLKQHTDPITMHKQERQFRKKFSNFNSQNDEISSRKKVSPTSYESSNDSETELTKKGSNNSANHQVGRDSLSEKCDDDRPAKKDRMKLNISNKGYNYGESQRDYVAELAYVSNPNSTKNGSTKHECIDISDLQHDDVPNDLRSNMDSPDSQSKSSGTPDASRTADETDNLNVMLGSSSNSRTGINDAIDLDSKKVLQDTSQPLCRVINVKPVLAKKTKKHRAKRGDSVDESHGLKKQSSLKECVDTNASKSHKRKDIRSKEKKKNKHKVSESQESGRKFQLNDVIASTTDKSNRHSSKNAEKEKLERNPDGFYFPSSNIQKMNGHSRKRDREKAKSKQASSAENHQRHPSKSTAQLEKRSQVIKSGRGQVGEDIESAKNPDSKQYRQKNCLEINDKPYLKKSFESNHWQTNRRTTEPTIDSKLKGLSKLKICDDDTTFKTEKALRKEKKRSLRDKTHELPKSSRISDTLDWHTAVHDVSDTVRPDLRESSKLKLYQGKRYKQRQKYNDTPQYTIRTSVSTDSASSYYSSNTSSESSASYDSQSSSERIEHLSNRKSIRYNGSTKERSSSCDSTGWPELKIPNNIPARSLARPRYPRSASSTSSFQRHEIGVDEAKPKQRQRTTTDVNAKRYDHPLFPSSRKTENEGNSPPPSPGDKSIEPKFGKRRTRPPNGSIVAEGEGGHTMWQHQLLVLVSQKPEASTGRKTVQKKFNQTKPSTNLLKKPVTTNLSNTGTDKRSLTIRHLYSLHNVLSDTQNGTVISGYRRSDRMRVAIKRISKPGTTRWGWLGRKVVPLELSLLCQVNETPCNGVISIVEWHETSEAFLLVMVRPHPAVDLYDYVNKHKRLKEAVAKYIIQQLVTALQHCIVCGVLHRDVKLENILLNPETMEITLIDFGCGDYVRSGPYTEFAGTPEYYAPEWFSRKQYNGEPLTAWSVGVLLYSLLCGSLPFRSAKEIREKEANKFPADVSRGAKSLVSSLLQKNPKERLALNSILSHPWLNKSDFRPGKNASS